MSEAVEIYICREGQALKDGKVEYGRGIENREDAQADAKARCRHATWIKKIAYYRVKPDGEFRIFYSYTNPDCVSASSAEKEKPKKKRKKKPKKKKTLFQKLLAFFK